MTSLPSDRFRWVSMQLQYLCDTRLSSVVRERLGTLPKDLAQLYEEVYEQRMQEFHEYENSLARHVFHYLMCFQEEIPSKTFIKAVKFGHEEWADLSQETLLDLCFNFVNYDADSDIFRFSHLSVREYLETRHDFEMKFNHALAAEQTLNHLLNVKMEYCSHVFHRYACAYWMNHMAKSMELRLKDPLRTLSYYFCFDSQHLTSRFFIRWVKCVREHFFSSDWSTKRMLKRDKWELARTLSNPADYIFLACAFEFYDLLEIRVGSVLGINDIMNHFAESPLHIACSSENSSIPRLLLENGAAVNVNQRDNLGSSPLYKAIFCHRASTVQLLLGKGADPKQHTTQSSYHLVPYVPRAVCSLLGRHPDEGLGPPLSEAVANRSEEIVRLLLENSADPYCSEELGSLLREAIEIGSEEIVRLLLENSADPDPSEYFYRRPLVVAISHGRTEIVRLLIQWKADISIKNLQGETILTVAVDAGHEGTTKFLVERTAIANGLPAFEWVLAAKLRGAIQEGQVSSFRALLDRWPSDAAHTSYLGVVLWYAVQERKSAISSLLLERGADPNTVYGDKPVLWAAVKAWSFSGTAHDEWLGLFRLLVGAGADVHLVYREQSILNFAIRRCSSRMDQSRVLELLEHDVDLNPKNCKLPPLYDAIQEQDVQICRMLLERGANANAVCDRNNMYWSRLRRVANAEHSMLDTTRYLDEGERKEAIIQLLLEFGAVSRLENQAS